MNNINFIFYNNKWTLAFTSDLVSPSPLKPHVHVHVYVYGSHTLYNVEAHIVNITSTHLTVNSNTIGYIYMPLVIRN